jgi:hypothetical protein
MGKASSSKKVARAARAGGRVSSGQPRSLLFPGVVALVVVLGLSLVLYARNDRQSQDMGGTPQLGDHIHLSFGVNVCGEWLPDLPAFESRVGIHTHSDGVIHVHPYSQLGVGANATLGKYFDDARTDGGLDVSISDSRVEWIGDEVIEEGTTECEGVGDPVLRVAYWDSVQDADAAPRVTSGGFSSLRLDTDGAGVTIFYGDPNEEIPRPPTADQLFELGARDDARSSATTPEGEVIPPETEPGDVDGTEEDADGADAGTGDAEADADADAGDATDEAP